MMAPRPAREVALDQIDWAKLIRPGELVVWGQASAEPVALTTSLMAQRTSAPPFRAFVGISWSESVDPAHTDRVAFSSYCAAGSNRRLGDALDILPIHYGALAETLGSQNPVLLLRLGRGRDDDHFSFGAANEYLGDLLAGARIVIAEVSPDMPRTGSGAELPRRAIDLIVNVDAPAASVAPTRFGAVERAIASLVAALIEDGSTLQIGLGGVPAAVLRALADHRDLGIHSGLIGDEVADLAETGVVTNARKSIDREVSVTGLLAGSERLMRWADAQPALALRPTSYIHDAGVLASIDRLVAINSAIEVDLTGQVNAEVASGRYVGAVGGAGAFLRGAHAARGGLPIIALPSTAGARSRIVRSLSGPVSTARVDAGLFVTEHGIADLRGVGLRERRRRMLDIADPVHRESLEQGHDPEVGL